MERQQHLEKLSTLSSASLRDTRGNGGYSKLGFLWPEQKKLATNQPLLTANASHGPLMFL